MINAIATGIACALAAAIAVASRGASPNPNECPTGQTDTKQAALVRAVLAGTEDGKRLATSTAPPPHLCFTDGEAGLGVGRVAFVRKTASVHAQAARYAHLWQHAVDGKPTSAPSPGESCATWLDDTLQAEARGDGVEERVLHALGDDAPRDGGDHAARDAAYGTRCDPPL